MKSIADSFGSKPELNTSGKIGRYLSLVNYNINPVTSAMFITATAPNPLIVSLIAKGTHGSFELSWSMWAIAALVPGLCSLLVMPLVIYLLYPPEVKSTPDAPRFARPQDCPPARAHRPDTQLWTAHAGSWAPAPAALGPSPGARMCSTSATGSPRTPTPKTSR